MSLAAPIAGAKDDSDPHGGTADAVDGEAPELAEMARSRVRPSFYILR